MSFHIDRTSVYLFGEAADVGLTGTSVEATIGELVDSMSPEQPSKKKKLPANHVVSNFKRRSCNKFYITIQNETELNLFYCSLGSGSCKSSIENNKRLVVRQAC